MTLEELYLRAHAATQSGVENLTLILPAKRPKGFPRGELACQGHDGHKVYWVNAKKILRWLKANGYRIDVPPSEVSRE